MFAEIHFGRRRQQDICLSASLAVHFLILGWMLHSTAPTFVSPSSVVSGNYGASLTPLYFSASVGDLPDRAGKHLVCSRPLKSRNTHPDAPIAKLELEEETRVPVASNQALAGMPFGSLSYGTVTGPEVRPALPVFSPDPILEPELRNSASGDVVIEITIDEAGSIVQSQVVQSLGPQIDQKVLAAVLRWQFQPATRDGTAIVSKQDVYYHFPR
jgi:TonB family protein